MHAPASEFLVRRYGENEWADYHVVIAVITTEKSQMNLSLIVLNAIV